MRAGYTQQQLLCRFAAIVLTSADSMRAQRPNEPEPASPERVQDIAVNGEASKDPDFAGESDRVRCVLNTAGRSRPFRVEVALRYQPISFRWAQNLRAYDAMQTKRFLSWYERISTGSSEVLARTTVSVP